MRLTVIEGRRDPRLVRAATQIQKLIRQGATVKLEAQALLACEKLGLRLTQIKTLLSRCRVTGFEANAESLSEISLVIGTTLEGLEDQRIVKEFALKVVVEKPAKPGRVAVIDIGQLKERE